MPSPQPQVLRVHVSPADLCDNEEVGDAHLIEASGCPSCYCDIPELVPVVAVLRLSLGLYLPTFVHFMPPSQLAVMCICYGEVRACLPFPSLLVQACVCSAD